MSAERALATEVQARPLCWREFDARRLNRIMNDPAVRSDVADMADGAIDMTKGVDNFANVNLVGDHGGCFFLHVGAGTYEVHTQFLKSGRGSWGFAFAKAAVTWMFTQTDAFEITTRIPITHDGARMLAIKTGMRHEFTRTDGCRFRGDDVPVDIFSFRIQDWASKCDAFERAGEEFHIRLNERVRANGVEGEPHGDDRNHNRYIGIALAMIGTGQVVKAVNWYNRWAIASRHRVVQLLQLDPPAIKFDAGTLVFLGDDFVVRP